MTRNTEPTGTEPKELTLDPSDWAAFRALGHRMVQAVLDQGARVAAPHASGDLAR